MARRTNPLARRLPQASYTAATKSPNFNGFFAWLDFITRRYVARISGAIGCPPHSVEGNCLALLTTATTSMGER